MAVLYHDMWRRAQTINMHTILKWKQVNGYMYVYFTATYTNVSHYDYLVASENMKKNILT